MKGMFSKLAKTEHGTVHFIEDNVEDHIDAYWGLRKYGMNCRIRWVIWYILKIGITGFILTMSDVDYEIFLMDLEDYKADLEEEDKEWVKVSVQYIR